MRARYLVTLALCLALVPAVPGGARPEEPPPRNVAAWLPYWVFDDAVRKATANADVLGSVSPFWYDAASCSRINGKPTSGDAGAVGRLRAKGLTVLPSVTAGGLPPRAAIRCFENGTSRRAHVARLVRLARSLDVDGLDIDYENLALTTDVGQARRVRRAFTAFVGDLCPALRRNDRTCSITVMPRTSAEFTVWRGKLIPAVYDYKRLVTLADEVRVMAYDQHAHEFGPGPVAGFPWVTKVAAFAAEEMGTETVRLGIPTYGRMWTVGVRDSTSLSGDAALALARQHRVKPHWDRTEKEFRFTFRSSGRRHTVWFSGPRSVAARARYADRLGFLGTALWAAGLDAAGTWQALRTR